MTSNNSQKKKAIDIAVVKYNARLFALKQKRNKIISNFLKILKEKKLEKLRSSLKQL